MTSTLTKHPKRFEVRVHADLGAVLDVFYVEGDLQDVKRKLRDRRAHVLGRRVDVFKLGGKPRAGRPPTVTYRRTSPKGPWLRAQDGGAS